jgi:hypothetical protein
LECPLNSGVAVTDQLLAAITRDHRADDFESVLDAALDLRLLLAAEADAESILKAFCRLRRIAEDRHYLACFRLRRWLESNFSACVFFDRSQPPTCVALRLDVCDCTALRTRCTLAALDGDTIPAWVHVRFVAQPAPSQISNLKF